MPEESTTVTVVARGEMRVVEVHWIDSAVAHGWFKPDEMTVAPQAIESIGYLVEETDDRVVITGHIAEDGAMSDPMAIPCFAITAMWALKVTKGKKR